MADDPGAQGRMKLNGEQDYIMRLVRTSGDTVDQNALAPSGAVGVVLEIYLIRAIALNLNATYHEIFF